MIVRGMARTQKRRLVELYVHTSPWHELVCPPPPKPRRKLTPTTPSDDQPSRARESLVDTLLRSSKQFYEETAFANATDGVDPNGIAEFQDLMRASDQRATSRSTSSRSGPENNPSSRTKSSTPSPYSKN